MKRYACFRRRFSWKYITQIESQPRQIKRITNWNSEFNVVEFQQFCALDATYLLIDVHC